MTNFKLCPKCGGKAPAKSTPNGVQRRVCDDCGYVYHTRNVIVLADSSSEIEALLADFGIRVNKKTLERLANESNIKVIREYLDNADWLISHYEARYEPVKNREAFTINAMLKRHPIPERPFAMNGYHYEEPFEVVAEPEPKTATELADEIWRDMLVKIKQPLTNATYQNLFMGSKGVYATKTTLVVQVGQYALEWVEKIREKNITPFVGEWTVIFIV